MSLCNHCAAVTVNGRLVHERGCPATPVECRECGTVYHGLDAQRQAHECEALDIAFEDDEDDDDEDGYVDSIPGRRGTL